MHEHGTGRGRDDKSHGHPHDDPFDSNRLATVLEVEGEVSSTLTEEAIRICARQLDEAGVKARRIIDVGCGPGVGTTSLAEAFPSAQIVALDGSGAMLQRAGARTSRLGYDARVDLRQLDINEELRTLERCQLVWAGMAIHHANDEVATLTSIGSLLEPGGLLCLLERADPMSIRFKSDLGRPGLWDRLEVARRAWFEGVRETMPGAVNAESYHLMLAAAELDILVSDTLACTVEAGSDAAAQQFVAGQLERAARDLVGFADDADLEVLRAFSDVGGAFHRGRFEGAAITSSRKLFVARPQAD